jgi:hypothetical protein
MVICILASYGRCFDSYEQLCTAGFRSAQTMPLFRYLVKLCSVDDCWTMLCPSSQSNGRLMLTAG